MRQKVSRILERFLICILIFTVLNSLEAQHRLSTPLEILDFMEASETEYEIQQLIGDRILKQRFVLPHGASVKVDSGIEHLHYAADFLSKRALDYMHAGRKTMSVQNPKTKKARRLYNKILAEAPENAQIHTLIGETYYQENKFEKAKKWLEIALDKNPIDYLAHWWTAEIYVKEGKLENAVKSITLAHIYNRNNPRLAIRLQEIYQLSDRKYNSHWQFEPQYYIDQEAHGDTILIVADGIWLTYAMYKAVWNFEADYEYIKSQQGVTDYLFYEEMEAVLGTYMTYENMVEKDQRNFPAMRALALTLDKEMLEAYVMYEILLVDRPTLASYLTTPFLNRIIAYIQVIRSQDFM